ncbi:BnaA03g60010D [Brassica napus]|uniref:BnaA03g60010D protein n=2 Tax=Brassica TaxID=3705 RepID=A0A078GIM1_BRANA|nr:BnaA03g60010D [Brassica napus]
MNEKWRRGDETMRDFTGTWFNKSIEEMETCFPTSTCFPHY